MAEDPDAMVARALAEMRTFERADGRTVSYAEFGAPTGRPLIHFHGTGFSSLEALTGDRVAHDAGVRLIAFDRPGFGGSETMAGRGFMSVAADALALTEHLGIASFDVSGFSGGVPHALATAVSAGGRCGRVLGVNTAGDVTSGAWRELPVSARLLVRIMTSRAIARRMWPRMFADITGMLLPGSSPKTAALLEAAFRHGSAAGHDASLDELALFYRLGWGNLWTELAAPVTLFHGRRDDLLPFARALAVRRPGTTLVQIPGGHMDWSTDEVWHELIAAVS